MLFRSDEIQRLLKVLLRFRGKADHDIGGDLTIGNAFPQHFYFIEIFVECVFTVHFLQDTVGARLHGKMHEAAYLRVFGNGGDKIFGEIFGGPTSSSARAIWTW